MEENSILVKGNSVQVGPEVKKALASSNNWIKMSIARVW